MPFRRLMTAEVDLAEGYLRRGLPLVRWMPPELQLDVALFVHGGLAILRAIQAAELRCLEFAAGGFQEDQAAAALDVLVGVEAGPASGERGMSTANEILTSQIACERLTRQAGSNFPRAFALLPVAKRQAMHALYAFMRHSDDLADDPPTGHSPREVLRQWRGAIEKALAGQMHTVSDFLGEVDRAGACDPSGGGPDGPRVSNSS